MGIHGAAIYGIMDPINIPQSCYYIYIYMYDPNRNANDTNEQKDYTNQGGKKIVSQETSRNRGILVVQRLGLWGAHWNLKFDGLWIRASALRPLARIESHGQCHQF